MPRFQPTHPVGVIDIGSNSVRLVIFDGLKRHLRPIFNEKVLCGLGSDLAKTGRLPEKGKAEAAACFARYVMLAQALPVAQLRIIATAAIRDAEDGPAFMHELAARHGVTVEILPGDEEARLAALGVLATIHQPRGLGGDLGGGSLELSAIEPGKVGSRVSLPLGVLRLAEQGRNDAAATRRLIDKQLDAQGWIGEGACPQFYAVGGSFRMLARVHMKRTDYPLRLLHHYRLAKRDLKRFTDDMLRLNLHAVASLKGMQAERAHMLLPGLLVLERVIERAGAEEVVFCTGGIREGLFYDALPTATQKRDPLLAYVDDVAPAGALHPYGERLTAWLVPLTERTPKIAPRLIEAFVRLSDLALGMHSEYRAQSAYDTVLYSSCTGLTHPERVWLSLSLYHRYRIKLRAGAECADLLDESEKASARLIGLGAALAYMLTGGAATLLDHFSLRCEDGRITLKSDGSVAITERDEMEKLLEGLGESARALDSRAR